MRIDIYCDGSCPIPESVGGWAFIILHPRQHISSSGAFELATNNTMELCACLEALRQVKRSNLRGERLRIISDSQYLIQGMTGWRQAWIRKNYEGVKNAEWWKLLHHHYSRCASLEFQWVRGHGNSHWNNWVDKAAGAAQRQGLIELQKQMEVENGS